MKIRTVLLADIPQEKAKKGDLGYVLKFVVTGKWHIPAAIFTRDDGLVFVVPTRSIRMCPK